MKSQTGFAWAICSDSAGIMEFTLRRTRSNSIAAFMKIAHGPNWSDKQWRSEKRRGFRASRVELREMLFGKGEQP